MKLSILHDKIKYDEPLSLNSALQVAKTQIIHDEAMAAYRAAQMNIKETLDTSKSKQRTWKTRKPRIWKKWWR